MEYTIGFILGAFVGVFVGVLMTCMAKISKGNRKDDGN